MNKTHKTIHAAFNNPHQLGLNKIVSTGFGLSPQTEFRASRPGHVAPVILEEYVNDDGDIQCILDNGNEMLKDKYDAMWKTNRTPILPKKKYNKGYKRK
jgi:hypothetical protein